MRLSTLGTALLLPHLRAARFPYRYAILSRIVFGTACAIVGVLMIFAVSTWLPPEHWGVSAAAFLGNLNPMWIFMLAVLWIPLQETLIAQVLPLEIGRRIGWPDWACILIVAGLFGLGHYLNGGLAHGICTVPAGALFCCAYLHVRAHGWRVACLASSTAHALNNYLVLYVMPMVFPQLA